MLHCLAPNLSRFLSATASESTGTAHSVSAFCFGNLAIQPQLRRLNVQLNCWGWHPQPPDHRSLDCQHHSVAFDTAASPPPFPTPGTLVIGSSKTSLFLLDTSTGRILQTFSTSQDAPAGTTTSATGNGESLADCMDVLEGDVTSEGSDVDPDGDSDTEGGDNDEGDGATGSTNLASVLGDVAPASRVTKAQRRAREAARQARCRKLLASAVMFSRIDYVVTAFDAKSGQQRWNLSYGEMRPLSGAALTDPFEGGVTASAATRASLAVGGRKDDTPWGLRRPLLPEGSRSVENVGGRQGQGGGGGLAEGLKEGTGDGFVKGVVGLQGAGEQVRGGGNRGVDRRQQLFRMEVSPPRTGNADVAAGASVVTASVSPRIDGGGNKQVTASTFNTSANSSSSETNVTAQCAVSQVEEPSKKLPGEYVIERLDPLTGQPVWLKEFDSAPIAAFSATGALVQDFVSARAAKEDGTGQLLFLGSVGGSPFALRPGTHTSRQADGAAHTADDASASAAVAALISSARSGKFTLPEPPLMTSRQSPDGSRQWPVVPVLVTARQQGSIFDDMACANPPQRGHYPHESHGHDGPPRGRQAWLYPQLPGAGGNAEEGSAVILGRFQQEQEPAMGPVSPPKPSGLLSVYSLTTVLSVSALRDKEERAARRASCGRSRRLAVAQRGTSPPRK